MSKMEKVYNKFNLLREKHGLPTLSRREFVRALAIASAGSYVPFLSCTNSDNHDGSSAGGGTGGVPPIGGGAPTTDANPVSGAGQSGGFTGGTGGGVPPSGGVGGTTPVSTGGSGSGTGGNGTGGSDVAGSGTGTGGSDIAGSGTGGDDGMAGQDAPVIPPDHVAVGITRNADTTAAVAAAIEAAGGLGDIQQGQKVFIKPNISVSSPGGFTSVPVMRGIIEAVSQRTDPQNITIAECTSMGGSTAMAAAAAGYTALIAQMGVKYLWFDNHEYAMFQDPKWTYLKMPKSVPVSVHPDTKQYDHFILAPVLKNHSMVNGWIPNCDVDFTCCMKLFIGILPYLGTGGRSDRADDPHNAKLGENVAELNCIVPKVTMCVVDAIRPGILNGPTPTMFANAGLVIASKDRVACDSVAFATLKNYGKNTRQTYTTRPVWEQSQIRHAGELGLGIADPNKITVEQIDVNNIDEIMEQWA